MSADLHHRVTAIILAQLATADPASWTPPWHGADPLPRNALSGRRYRGLNTLALWCAAQQHGFVDPRWATYRQWAALGAQVRRHARGSLVLFYRDLPHADATGIATEPSSGRPTAAGDDTTAPRFVARASHVFNAEQVDDAPALAVPPNAAADASTGATTDALPTFDRFVTATGAVVREGGNRACYVPATDSIHLPARTAFVSAAARVATLAHELAHWTGAPHRLHRELTGRFGTKAYAAEELVAELGAAFVLAALGLARHPHPDHAAYVAGWLPLLRDDPRALATAAAHAGRAADHLFALVGDTDAPPSSDIAPSSPAPVKSAARGAFAAIDRDTTTLLAVASRSAT